MGLNEKIEQIRMQPESVRIKYVWGCVAASMFLIILIWFFSIAAMLKKDMLQTESDNIDNLKAQLKDINDQAPSIKDIGQDVLKVGEGINGNNAGAVNTDLQYPLQTETEEAMPSSEYKKE